MLKGSKGLLLHDCERIGDCLSFSYYNFPTKRITVSKDQKLPKYTLSFAHELYFSGVQENIIALLGDSFVLISE